ncbi:globin domain-containing protein [Streptomyces iconiensis]|uniref:nitric oxide dioxygenase n=1 Tax=Streptomyces iconiensis TaxID=1384038 RepID=A0ABT6ZRL0_9ACTN|nr:globin domain-containing protein [Streptomyces iconiensis]MDJ1131707.1 globin domain-containing protein [Streptomyces iconiensis]
MASRSGVSGSEGAFAGDNGGRGWFSPPESVPPESEKLLSEQVPSGQVPSGQVPSGQVPSEHLSPDHLPAEQVPSERPSPERLPPEASSVAPASGSVPPEPGGPRETQAPPHAASSGPAAPSSDAALVQATLQELEGSADAATAYFYALLFVQYPQLREMFPASMDTQRDRLFHALLTSVRLYDDPKVLADYLSGLGRGHRKYGTLPAHYPAVGECLMAALSQYAPRSWGPRTEAAWVRAYTAISQIMIDAAAEDERRAPAWWQAEIVTHEQRTPEIAVITVRPDQPYPFRAGQYTSIETPWWPRVWRHYSFASAPRSDGLLTFHVKSVPAGWVSTALVQRARPGDVLRLGPPNGSMTIDHRADSGLLCLGGGTGIAPIKALVEDVAGQGRSRPVEVFYGARTDHDLYDLDTMLRLEQRYDWLAVRPVVAAGPAPSAAYAALAGQLPEAVRRYGPFAAYDGYLSGPPGMIRTGVETLVGLGIPTHRIRHDSLEELVATGG